MRQDLLDKNDTKGGPMNIIDVKVDKGRQGETVKIKYVKQEHSGGCAIACFAMILGKTYWQVAKEFSTKAKSGVSTYKIRDYLGAQGFSLVIMNSTHYSNVQTSNARMKKLLIAPIHLVSVKVFANSTSAHAVVVDRKGKVYDPGPAPDTTYLKTLDDYFQIIEIMACFPD